MWVAQWRETMLNDNAGRLQGLARNYLGQSERVAADKEKIVSSLGAMLSAPDVQRAAVAMMDRLDKLIVGTIYVAGEADRFLLQKSLAGEVSYHELDYRLANLGERLLIFSVKENIYAVNPFFSAAARAGAARADILFGTDSGERRMWGGDTEGAGPGKAGSGMAGSGKAGSGMAAEAREFLREGPPPALLSVQDLGLITYALLKEYRDILLKSGQLSIRARKRLSVLFPGDPAGAGIVEAIIHALLAAKIASRDEHGMSADFKAFSELLVSHSGDFAFALVGLTAGNPGATQSGMLAQSFAPFFGKRFSFSLSGLGRFIRLLPNGNVSDEFSEAVAAALRTFGLLEETEGGLRCVPERLSVQWRAVSEDAHAAISVDGSGLIHILPSASIRDIVALLDIGILVAASGAWEITLTRASIRRAFASGRSIEDIERMLGRMSGMPVPQALSFDIRAWEEEYNSIRLFRGYVLSADKSSAKIIEQSGTLSRFPHEMLGEGIYFFGTIQASIIEKALIDIGLPPPAMRSSAKAASGKSRRAPGGPGVTPSHDGNAARGDSAQGDLAHNDAAHGDIARETHDAVSEADFGNLGATMDFAEPGALAFAADEAIDPEPLLVSEISRLPITPEFRKRLEERLKRKLIYTLPQLHAMVGSETADSKTGHVARYSEAGLSARGLDFNGKVRVIQAALKAKYSRLDIRWAIEGEIRTVAVRPVNLRKTEKDYVLEGEDVASGAPISIRVGSVMQVSLHKGFLLGEE